MAPTSIELLGRGREEVIEVNEGEEITLECQVEDAKPVAMVRWYKNNEEIHLGKRWRSSQGAQNFCNHSGSKWDESSFFFFLPSLSKNNRNECTVIMCKNRGFRITLAQEMLLNTDVSDCISPTSEL